MASLATPRRLLEIGSEADVEEARRAARSVATLLGFDVPNVETIVLVASELSANLVRYAWQGRLSLTAVDEQGRRGIQLASYDEGPGIVDLGRALEDGFSTGGGLGHGLPGVQRLMDDFVITSKPGGTSIVVHKWLTDR